MRCRPVLATLVVITACLHPRLARADDVSIVPGKDAIEFKVGSTVVSRYHVGPAVAKPYFWPVLAPGNVPVTRGWPMEPAKPKPLGTEDHIHQKSAWFCHGDVIPEGIELKTRSANKSVKGVNFWDEIAGHGIIACVKVGEPKQLAKDHAAITTWNEWRTADGVKLLDEERTIHFRDLPAGRLFVVESKLTASVCPITFGDTKEGSFGVRVHDELRTDKPGGGNTLSNSAGKAATDKKTEPLVWGQLADWCDYSGAVDGKPVGVAVFDDPKNPSRAAWHARGYGLLAANAFGRDHSGFPARKGMPELVRIEKGKDLVLRYGFYAHTGDTKSGKVAEAFETFKK